MNTEIIHKILCFSWKCVCAQTADIGLKEYLITGRTTYKEAY